MEFMNLKHGSMSVKENDLKFNQLPRFSLEIVAKSKYRLTKFVSRVS